MTYLDPSGNTDGAEQYRHRARHAGAAPEPYIPSFGDETLVFDQPLRTTEQRHPRTAPRRSRAERRRAERVAARTEVDPMDVASEAVALGDGSFAGAALDWIGEPPFSGGDPSAPGDRGAVQRPLGGGGSGSGRHGDAVTGSGRDGAGKPPRRGRRRSGDGSPDGDARVDGPGSRSESAGRHADTGGDERAGSPEQPGGAAPKRAGRAGRDLPAAIGVGVSLAVVVLGSLLFWRPAFLAVLVSAVGVAVWEMTSAVRRGGANPPLLPLLSGGVIMVGLAWFGGSEALCSGLLLTVLAVLIWRLGDGPAHFQRDVTAAILITVYVPFLGGFAALLAVPEQDGHLRVLVTLAAVVLSDTGGYAAGVFLGRHPMAPTVSPKKSWEGFVGSLTATAFGSGLLLFLLLDIAPWQGALFGMALSSVAVLGDLTESMIKRDLGVKDMSSLLPGHGGLMDRLDSILFALPTGYLMLSLLAPTG